MIQHDLENSLNKRIQRTELSNLDLKDEVKDLKITIESLSLQLAKLVTKF